MAKNFPFFKFVVTEWMTGDIVFEDFAVQGLFINICALYWQRDGSLSIEDINKRFKNPVELTQLTDRFFSVSNGLISVHFLDEQLVDANHISKVNSLNGAKGGRPKVLIPEENKPNANPSLSEPEAKKSKEEQEQEIKKNNIEVRKLKFADTLKPFVQKYGKELVREFFNYWTEPNKSNTKFKQEMQSTWSTERRLDNWSKNSGKFDAKKETPKKLNL